MIKDIKMVRVKLTNQCNLNCLMCGQKKNSDFIRVDICLESLEKTISEIYQENKNFEVFLWGGEPLLYKQLPDLLKFLRDKHLRTTINTNGVELEKYADVLCENRVYRIIVSLDGINQLHNQIRGANVFDGIIRGIKTLKNKKTVFPFITTNTVIMNQNYDRMNSIAEYFAELGIDYMEWQLPMFYNYLEGLDYEKWAFKEFGISATSWRGYQGSYKNMNIENLILSIKSLKSKYPRIARVVPELSENEMIRYFNEKAQVRNIICSVVTNQLKIESNGDVVICADFPDVIVGNISNQTVKEILKNPIYGIFQNSLKKNCGMPLCKKCVMLYEG